MYRNAEVVSISLSIFPPSLFKKGACSNRREDVVDWLKEASSAMLSRKNKYIKVKTEVGEATEEIRLDTMILRKRSKGGVVSDSLLSDWS